MNAKTIKPDDAGGDDQGDHHVAQSRRCGLGKSVREHRRAKRRREPAPVLIGETVVVALEASILVLAVRRERAALIAGALVANAASLLVGLVLQP